jgi:TRAP-type C4-dicarboxylate transport system substrate-binding protein
MKHFKLPHIGRSLALAASLFAPSAVQAADFDWRYYSVSPQGHPYSVIISEAFDRIEQRSGGRLDIDLVYFGETPYKGAEAEKLMRDGLGEMTEWLVSYSTSTYPLLSAPELPFLLAAAEPLAVQSGPRSRRSEGPEDPRIFCRRD